MEDDLKRGVFILDRVYCTSMKELRESLQRGEVRYLKVYSIEQVSNGHSVFPRMLVYYKGGHSDLSFFGFRYVNAYLELIVD